MRYKSPFHLRPFLLIVLAMIFSSTAFAKDLGALRTQTRTAGDRVSGVDVSLEPVSGGKVLTTKTDDRGSFTFSDVAPGSYKLRIGCVGVGAISRDVAGGAGAQRCYAEFRIEITDKSTGVITGAIRRQGS